MLKSTRLATDTYRRGPKPTGVAVVGVDHPGRRILRVLRENFQAEVLWLCDPDQERLENLERRCPGARVATGIDGVVDDPAVEAVFVGGPAEAKCGLITQVLEAGKHVFIHTPQEWGSEPPDEIADTASAHGRILRCGTPLLHSPPVHAIKQVVSSGEMGELDFVSSSRVGTDVAPPELDVIADLGPRELFVVLYWLAELPVTVRAASRAVVQPGVADIACITLTFASDLLVNLELSRVGPPALSRTVLVGRCRMAIYDESADQQVRLFDRGGVRTAPRGDEDGEDRDSGRAGQGCLQLGLREILAPAAQLGDPLAIEVDAFISAVRQGEQTEPRSALARNVLRVTEAARLSLGNGGRNVPLAQAEPLPPYPAGLHAVR